MKKFAHHWWRTTFHPIRHLANDPKQILTKKLYNPRHGTIWGVRRNIEVIDMHREFFLKGEGKKEQLILEEVVERDVIPGLDEHFDQNLDWYFN